MEDTPINAPGMQPQSVMACCIYSHVLKVIEPSAHLNMPNKLLLVMPGAELVSRGFHPRSTRIPGSWCPKQPNRLDSIRQVGKGILNWGHRW
jgi:hypothetical protein